MAHNKRKHKRRKTNRENYYTYDNSDNMTISQEDLYTLELLYIQRSTDIFIIFSDILSFLSTQESIDLIYSRYYDTGNSPNPDIPLVYAAYINFFASLIYAKLAFAKYEYLNEKSLNGELDYSLWPNIDINFANVFGILKYSYALSGTLGIYERDLSQPIVGV